MGLWNRIANVFRGADTATAVASLTQEVAIGEDSLYSRMPTLQYSPDELLTKKGFAVLEKMMTDDQVDQCITSLKLIRLSSGYELEPGDDSPQAKELADFVGYVLENMRSGCSMHNVLFNIMGGLEMGWSLNELVWEYYKAGKYKGKLGLAAIKSKNPKHFNIQVDEFQNPISVVSVCSPAYGATYPIDKFLLYSFQKRYENVFGRSRLRSVYQWWWVKQTMIRAMGVYMEKFGLPVPIGTFPRNFTKTQQDDFLTALTKLRIEHAIILPDGSKVDFKEATGKGADSFLAIINKADDQIAKVILGQTLSSGTGKGTEGGALSSGALGSVQFDILVMYLDYLGLDIAIGPMNTLIKKIVDYNFANVEAYPIFKFKPLFPEDQTPTIDSFIKCVEARIVTSTPEDEEQIRKILGFKGQSGNVAKLRPTTDTDEGAEKKTEDKAPVEEEFQERRLRRKLTQFEERVDFPGIVEIQDDAVARILPAAQASLREMVDSVMKEVQKSEIVEKNKISLINELDFRGKGDLNRMFARELERVATSAQRDARREVRTIAKHVDLDWMTPLETLKYLKEKSFWMTDIVVEKVLSSIKGELFKGIKSGKPYGDIYNDVLAAVEPYVGKPGVGSEISEDLLAARLETVVRTNVSEAYNVSRDSVFTSPDMQDLVVAFQYSAILDDRVRPNHEKMDGRIYAASDPIWKTWTPPNGFNCRCVKVPLTKYDKFKLSAPISVRPDEGFK